MKKNQPLDAAGEAAGAGRGPDPRWNAKDMKHPPQRYDIIGDIHGHADTLRLLLEKLGYGAAAGVYRHAERQAVFVGDFIDRGPQIRETLQIVRAMVEAGSAHAVLGNHEFNAIRFHTRGPDGEPLRARNEKNVRQHSATLEQLAVPRPEEWEGWLEWFKGLPLCLDLGGLRVVHAAWCPRATAEAGARRFRDASFLMDSSTPGTPEHEAVKTLLNGPEVLLPEGVTFTDKEGHEHEDIRARWFGGGHGPGATYADAIFPPNDRAPALAIPHGRMDGVSIYPESEPVVVFGHYWMPPAEPAPVARNAACVDFSVAGKAGGQLSAYRWDGEAAIDPGKFVSVVREAGRGSLGAK